MNYSDPLIVVNSGTSCPECRGEKPKVKKCQACSQSGHKKLDLSGMWYPSAGFLVCGGPSINEIPYHKLSERGIVSLGINNAAGHVPCSAWCFSDPQEKFHHGLFLDPAIMTFAPIPKLSKRIRVKRGEVPEWTDIKVGDCPNTFGFARKSFLDAENFLTTDHAQWGYGGDQAEADKAPFTCLCTMLLGIRLMCYLGCSRIFLLGVDFLRTEEAQYSWSQKASISNKRYSHENYMLREIRPALEKKGIQIYNCNLNSNCDAFDFVKFEDAFTCCKGLVPDEPFDLSGWYEKDEAQKKKK